MKFLQDTYVWVPDDDDMFLPAKVVTTFESGKPTNVKMIGDDGKPGKTRKISGDDSEKVIRMNEQSLRSIEDMVGLKSLDEASILHNLRLRYKQDAIYTHVGKILVALNPFKMLPIYSPQVMDEYMENGARNLDPHVYGVADDAFRALMGNRAPQSCIVSGESGAGKTETTKLFLQYIAEKSKRESQGTSKVTLKEGESSIQHKVLEANPLLEAFGNAKTVRNNNSSRFGKWIEIQFTTEGEIVGGTITNYLLEKSRLVTQGEGERNYHIFYQMCAAANMDPELKKKYRLSDATQYYYLNQSKRAATEIKGVDDADEWKSTQMAMDVVAISDKDRESVLTALSGILHLGNIRFKKGSSDENSVVENTDMLELAAEQLGCKPDVLSKALTKRLLIVGREKNWADNNTGQAADARDALAKQAYSYMFDWLIDQVNIALGMSKKRTTNIGVLDIFGFETFEKNSFEQLCINYCNEKLQGHFNNHIFKLEQAEYEKEGVPVDKITFEDNSGTIMLIEAGKGKGILALVDEQIKVGNRGSDQALLKNVLNMKSASEGRIDAPSNKEMKKRSHLKYCFIFTHYAGDVEYDTTGFVEKSRDKLQDALQEVGVQSTNPLLGKLFKSADTSNNKKSLGAQFKNQLSSLMDQLESTEPHFVRCIKPNKKKVGDLFEAEMTLNQLRYAGVLEVCKIRQQGYPIRKDFKNFVRTYKPLAGGEKVKDAPSLCKVLEKNGVLVQDEYQVGKNKVFMRDNQVDQLEEALDKVLARYLQVVQKVARGFILRNRMSKWKTIEKNIKSATKARDRKKLEEALVNIGILPYGGRHLGYIIDAKALLDVLKEEDRVVEILETALESQDLSEIKRALKAAEEKNMGGTKLAKEAKAAMKRIESEKEVRETLRAAIDKGDNIGALEKALGQAKKANIMNSIEARDAQALLDRLTEQEETIDKLGKAIKAKNIVEIKRMMNKLVELGQSDHPLIEEAQNIAKEQAKASKEREEQQEQLLDQLDEAMAHRDLNRLNDLEVEVLKIGLDQHEIVKKAMALRKELEASSQVVSALGSEMRAAIHKAQSSEGIEGKDVDAVSQTLQDALQSGVPDDDPKIKEAKELIEKLEKQMQVQQDLDAVVKEAEAKGKNKKDMMQTLTEAVQSAQSLGIDTTSARKIKDWVVTIEQEDAEFNQKELAKRRQKNLERLKEATKDELEQQAMLRLQNVASEKHKKLIEQAKDDAVYELKKYYKIRTNEDFTENLPEEERAIAAKLKLWSRQKPIPKSLLKLGDEQNRTAMRINRAILQYCGDMSTSFPATLAQYTLVKGLEDPTMCDEIYMQLCKHVYVNPKPESADRAWLLMCMASKTFPPSDAFTPYLLNFLIRHQTLPGLPGNYARLCIVQLDATIELGPSSYKPNLEEIQCYRKRPPILAPITMVDGETKQFPITPDLRVAQVVEMIRRQENIQDNVETPTWGIFVRDGKENGKPHPKVRLENFYKQYNPSKLKHVPLFLEHWKGKEEELFAKLVDKYGPEPDENAPSKKKTLLSVPLTSAMSAVRMMGLTGQKKAPPAPQKSWCLPWWSHLGDVYLRMTTQGKEPVFTFKRRMILPSCEVDKKLYLQLLEDVQSGDLFFQEETDVALAALLAVTLSQTNFKQPKVDKLPELGIAKYIAPYWRRKKSPADWAKVAAASTDKLPRSESKLIEKFVNVCKKSDTYGMTYFYARRSDENEDYLVGVNHDAIHFLQDHDEKLEVVSNIPYTRIIKYGSTVEYFWLAVDEKALGGKKKGNPFQMGGAQGINILLYTLQSWELYEMVFDYTHMDQ